LAFVLSEWSGMPLAGGPSDKAGNSLERRWTVLTLADLLLATVSRCGSRYRVSRVRGQSSDCWSADRRSYEERNLEELRERARELDIEGRPAMGKDELIAALRQQAK
jgi:hypothetical protein